MKQQYLISSYLSSYERAVVESMRAGASIDVNFFNRKDSHGCEEALDSFAFLGLPMQTAILSDKRQTLYGWTQIEEVSSDGKHRVKLGFLNYSASTKKPAAVAPATDEVNSSAKHLQEEV